MKTYKGGCHCGAVAFTVETDLEKTLICNCSHCHIKGFVLTFVDKDKFMLEKGDDALTDYHFNKKVLRHRFCKICGVQSFAEGIAFPKMGINVRSLEGVDFDSLSPEAFNGKDV